MEMTAQYQPIVSIILPAYNASRFLQEAISSVINQSYQNWQLIIINDGSTDQTEEIVLLNRDSRIQYFKQQNKGVSSARNTGLQKMSGDYFCFLDADDVLPQQSLEVRVKKFMLNPELDFVDGTVHVFDKNMKHKIRTYQPKFSGNPLSLLLKISDKCFFGPSWMIRRHAVTYRMDEKLSHGEDLFFYLTLCRKGGHYDYVNEEILYYRRHDRSAMRNIPGLYQGYKIIYRQLLEWPEFSITRRIIYFYKMKKFIFLSFLSVNQYKEAFKALIS